MEALNLPLRAILIGDYVPAHGRNARVVGRYTEGTVDEPYKIFIRLDDETVWGDHPDSTLTVAVLATVTAEELLDDMGADYDHEC